MIQVMPNLHFNGNCKQAIELYEKAYGAEVKALIRYADANPQDFIVNDENKGDWVYHSEIIIGNHRLMLNDWIDDDFQTGNALSLLVHFDTEDECKKAYRIIAEEGATIISPMESQTYCACFASLMDKYGVRWDLMAG